MRTDSTGLKPDKRVIKDFIDSEFSGYSYLTWPDEEPGSNKEIDALFRFHEEWIAVEHTRIVRFEHEIVSDKQFQFIKKELKKRCEVPEEGSYVISLPCVNFGSKLKQEKLIKALVSCIPRAYKSVPLGRGVYFHIDGFPFKVWIYHRSMDLSGFEFRQSNPEGPNQYPNTDNSIGEKLSKLMLYGKKKCKTILLLENTVGNSDPFIVRDSIFKYEAENKVLLDRLIEIVHGPSGSINYCEYELTLSREIWGHRGRT